MVFSFTEVEMDKSRTWCPRAGCETVCTLCTTDRCTPQSVHCPTCHMDFCSNCRAAWHADTPCKSEEVVPGVTFDSELIKCCPMCSVPIEKDEGCAQMLCKRCKHVFCWYCLASLDVSTTDNLCNRAVGERLAGSAARTERKHCIARTACEKGKKTIRHLGVIVPKRAIINFSRKIRSLLAHKTSIITL